MLLTVTNPDELISPVLVHEDCKEEIFFDSPKERLFTLSYAVPANRRLELILVDFSRSSFSLSLQVDLARNSSAIVRIVSLSHDGEKKTYRADIRHLGEKSFSRTYMAGINLGNGTLSFLGNSTIINGAHKSDTRQEARITNLSLESKSEASPALCIQDYDVKASHGASLGAYDPNELFYLMSRGLSEKEAKSLITEGTLLPLLQTLSDSKMKEKTKTALQELSL